MNNEVKKQIEQLQNRMSDNNRTIDALTAQNVSIDNQIRKLHQSIYIPFYYCKKDIKEHDHKNQVYSGYCGAVKYIERDKNV